MKDVKEIQSEINCCSGNHKTGQYGVRHTIGIICFYGTLITYAMRTCLSVTIVAMVGKSSTEIKSINESDSELSRSSYESEQIKVGEFDWDDKTRGLVLGSFYYGYVITYGFGGRLTDYWGGRYPFGVSCLIGSLLTILSPLAAWHSSDLLIFIRIVHGITEGLGYVSVYKIISQWYTIEERSKFTSYIFSGTAFGIVISMAISGWLCTTNFLGGWPSVFYLFGTLGIICSALWFAFVYDDPYKHPRIKPGEQKYITQGLPETKDRIPVPWRPLLASRYIWIIVAANFGINWASYFILFGLPTYLDEVLNIEIKHNGLLSAAPFVGSTLVCIFLGYIMTHFSSKGVISNLSVRRISIALSGYIPVVGFLILAALDSSHSYVIVTIFFIMAAFLGAAACSFYCSPADIAPNFTGTITGLTNSFGNIPGFLAPALTGLLLQYVDTAWSWKIAFFLSAILTGIPTTVYFLFITTEIQPWNHQETKIETKPTHQTSNGSLRRETRQVGLSRTESGEGDNRRGQNNQHLSRSIEETR